MQLAAMPNQGESVAANTVGRRLEHRQGRCGGNRRIDRITAGLQHLEAGLRGQWLRGGHHAASGVDDVAARGVGKMLGIKRRHKHVFLKN